VYEGVDVEWVKDALSNFVEKTQPVRGQSMYDNPPACGRDAALAMSEVIEPILNHLYPEWRRENNLSQFDGYYQQRQAAKKLLVRLETRATLAEKLGGLDKAPRLSAASLHELVWKAASAQWATGHRHEAVLAAAKAVNSQLQEKVGRRDVSETDLVRQAFSEKAPTPSASRLRFPAVGDDKTQETMRQGAMDFGAGCFEAIRNPLGHRPNEEIELTEQEALERLAALSLFARWIDQATVIR
jgi:uncharacterized protein (TIGR02391 family)